MWQKVKQIKLWLASSMEKKRKYSHCIQCMYDWKQSFSSVSYGIHFICFVSVDLLIKFQSKSPVIKVQLCQASADGWTDICVMCIHYISSASFSCSLNGFCWLLYSSRVEFLFRFSRFVTHDTVAHHNTDHIVHPIKYVEIVSKLIKIASVCGFAFWFQRNNINSLKS